MTSPPPMPGQPFTIRDGWHRETYAGRQWLASDQMAASKATVRRPCLVVTGDLAAARARLAPPTLPAAYSPTDRVDAVGPRECVEFPCCGFAIDAQHIDASGDAYTCPLCDVTYQPPEKRARLAPLDEDTRTTAVDVCRAALALDNARTDGQAVTMRAVIEWCVDALVAAGLIRPAHDDAAIERAARALYVLDGYPAKDWAIETETTKDAYRRPARAALAAADQEEKP